MVTHQVANGMKAATLTAAHRVGVGKAAVTTVETVVETVVGMSTKEEMGTVVSKGGVPLKGTVGIALANVGVAIEITALIVAIVMVAGIVPVIETGIAETDTNDAVITTAGMTLVVGIVHTIEVATGLTEAATGLTEGATGRTVVGTSRSDVRDRMGEVTPIDGRIRDGGMDRADGTTMVVEIGLTDLSPGDRQAMTAAIIGVRIVGTTRKVIAGTLEIVAGETGAAIEATVGTLERKATEAQTIKRSTG